MSGSGQRRLPFGLDREHLWEWAWRAVMGLVSFFGLCGLLYLKTIFATNESVENVNTRVQTISAAQQLIVPRMESMERRQEALRTTQKGTEETLARIQADLAAVRATQAESTKNLERNFDRVFNKLDQIAPK
ncbi:MAG: hypothetical protein JSR30_00010 [Proteobacteria bacterium]|nr:hypothetical protein [Pseudomonadota bacterium]